MVITAVGADSGDVYLSDSVRRTYRPHSTDGFVPNKPSNAYCMRNARIYSLLYWLTIKIYIMNWM